jgi:hypothetical protein
MPKLLIVATLALLISTTPASLTPPRVPRPPAVTLTEAVERLSVAIEATLTTLRTLHRQASWGFWVCDAGTVLRFDEDGLVTNDQPCAVAMR